MEVVGTHNFAVNGGLIVHNCMDDIRYFANTIMKNKVGKATSNYTPIFVQEAKYMNEDIRNPEYFAKCIAEGLKKELKKELTPSRFPNW